MFITNAKSSSLGYLPLQSPHFAQGFGRDMSLSFREHVGAVRVETRNKWPDGFGDYQYDIDSVGDIHGGQLWRRNPNPAGGAAAREIPMWRFATPSIIKTPDPEDNIDEPDCANPLRQGLTYHPWKNIDDAANPYLLLDERLEGFQFKNPSCDPAQNVSVWNNQPAGIVGISLTTNAEDDQQNLFLPTDPRLIANTSSDPEFNSLVCDCEGFEISNPINGQPGGAQRVARLHTGFRVIASPLRGNCGLDGPFLALQADSDPCREVNAGAIAFQNQPGRSYTAGMIGWGQERGKDWHPPFHPGHDTDDMHKLATDVDGNNINVLHMWVAANFFESKKRDGPLDFGKDDYPYAQRGSTPWEVDLLWDKRPRQEDHCGNRLYGKWRWVAWTNEDRSGTGGRPGSGDVLEVQQSVDGGEGDGSGGDGVDRIPRIGDDDAGAREHLISYVEKGFPALLARPQFFAAEAEDYRTKIDGKTSQQIDSLRYFTPLTGRIESIGLQDGAEWSYKTTPGAMTGRYPSGVADGGFVLQSPDVGLEDFALGTYDSTADHATTSLLIAPDFSRLALGTPDPTNAEIMSEGFALDYESTTPSMRLRHWSGSAWTSHLTASAARGLEADANLSAKKALVLADGGALTISGGSVTVTASYHSLK